MKHVEVAYLRSGGRGQPEESPRGDVPCAAAAGRDDEFRRFEQLACVLGEGF